VIRYIALLTTTLLLTVSCSGGSDTQTAQSAPPSATAEVMSSVPTSTQVQSTPTQVVPPTATLTPTVSLLSKDYSTPEVDPRMERRTLALPRKGT